MAKYPHRIFEIYEFRDEAIRALTPTSVTSATDTTVPETWTFRYLTVSRSASVIHVGFKGAKDFAEDTVNDLRLDFSQLADALVRDSKLLLNFADVNLFCTASIDELIPFKQKLRIKGSRMALCCLDTAVRKSFFPCRD
jgi:hypothetical protein